MVAKKFTSVIMYLICREGVEVASLYDEEMSTADQEGILSNQQIGGHFTPVKVQTNPARFGGVAIKSFPDDCENDQIMEFLQRNGLPDISSDNVEFKSNGKVMIQNLRSD